MASPVPRRITVDEFLAGLTSDSVRLELIDGLITAMVGGTAAAHLIAGNIFGNLFNRLRGGRCVPFGDGMLVMVDEHSAFAPDVAVVCTPVGAQERYLTEPVVIVEVLLPSTESFDRASDGCSIRQSHRSGTTSWSRGTGISWNSSPASRTICGSTRP